MPGREIGSEGEELPVYHRVSTGEMPPIQLFLVRFVFPATGPTEAGGSFLSHRVVMQTQGFFTQGFKEGDWRTFWFALEEEALPEVM